MKKFALLGCGGYIAPRHIKAIKDIGGELTAAYDISDSVGILDSYFDTTEFFKTFEEFFNFIQENPCDYISICTPNYLHQSQIIFALRNGANAICEKPLVLSERGLDTLKKVEEETGKRVNTILQLRVHESIIQLKKEVESSRCENFEVELCYLTTRGPWYHRSWKGEKEKSGGLPAAIGIHFFDMLSYLFGSVKKSEVHLNNSNVSAGFLELEKARVKWFLSVDQKFLPGYVKIKGGRTYRSIKVNNKEVEFSEGFTDLHTKLYQDILNGHGLGLKEARKGISLTDSISSSIEVGVNENSHPLVLEFKNELFQT